MDLAQVIVYIIAQWIFSPKDFRHFALTCRAFSQIALIKSMQCAKKDQFAKFRTRSVQGTVEDTIVDIAHLKHFDTFLMTNCKNDSLPWMIKECVLPNGTSHGITLIIDEDAVVMKQVLHYDDGTLHGEQYTTLFQESFKFEEHFQYGIRTGIGKCFHGQSMTTLRLLIPYKNGKRHGTEEAWDWENDVDGDHMYLRQTTCYVNGIKHGRCDTYERLKDGSVACILTRHYHKGRLTSTHGNGSMLEILTYTLRDETVWHRLWC